MAQDKPLTISGIAYKVKDWLVIAAAIGGIVMYGTKVWSAPERLDKLEIKVANLSDSLISLTGDIKYIVKSVDEIKRYK